MREWLSGGAPPCQGGGRGFDPRLALLFLQKNGYLNRYPFLLQNRAQSRARRFDVSPAGSVVASASQRCPLDTRNPSRAFFFKEVSIGYLFCYFVPATCIEPARVRCLACRLGRCFCFAEVSTGDPQPVSRFFFCPYLKRVERHKTVKVVTG